LAEFQEPKLQVVAGSVDDKLNERTAWHHPDASVSLRRCGTEERLLEKFLSLYTNWKRISQ
jgi:hypothetical protein